MAPIVGDQIPQIPGVDSRDLLERIGEDMDLFWEVLGEFSESYRDSPAQIAAALAKDPALAKPLAHTLKGVLGNLSAQSLFATCKSLDDAIREGRSEQYARLIETLTSGVSDLCDAIKAARVPTPVGTTSGQPEVGWLGERLAALRVALDGHRARDSRAIADELLAATLPADQGSFVEEIHALVRAYRFKDARDLLDQRPHA